MTGFSEFIERNGAFVLSFVGLLGGGISYLLVFCLKSRCSNIKCCGLEISRIPIPLDQLNNVNLELPQENPQV